MNNNNSNTNSKNNIIVDKDSYISLNATIKLFDENGNFQFENDLLAVDKYLETEILPNFKVFGSVKEKLEYLFVNNYYDFDLFKKYSPNFLISIFEKAKSYNF
ncbi:MAG: hypothetical protein K2G54_02880, partial [Malacoplasma sp.]|nr:hypothetical protein [Malacoplasma sp.]